MKIFVKHKLHKHKHKHSFIKHISSHIIKYDQFWSFLFGLYSSILLCISFISFKYSIKALESFKRFKSVLSRFLINN